MPDQTKLAGTIVTDLEFGRGSEGRTNRRHEPLARCCWLPVYNIPEARFLFYTNTIIAIVAAFAPAVICTGRMSHNMLRFAVLGHDLLFLCIRSTLDDLVWSAG